jgi:hypothetical protein
LHATSSQPSSFATLFHQAKDDASAGAGGSGKDAQGQDKSARQAAPATPAMLLIPTVQQAVAPVPGFPAWGGTTSKSEKSTGPAEAEATATSSEEKKPDANATPAGTTLLMRALAGLGIPEFTQPLPVQQSVSQQVPVQRPVNDRSSKSGARVDPGVSAAEAAIGVPTSTKPQAIDLVVTSRSTMPTKAQAGSAAAVVDDPTPTQAQAIAPVAGIRTPPSTQASATAEAIGILTPASTQASATPAAIGMLAPARAQASTTVTAIGILTLTHAQAIATAAVIGVPTPTHTPAIATAAAIGVATSTNTPASASADDASGPSLSASPNADSSPRDGNTGTLLSTTPSEGAGQPPVSTAQLAFAARLNADAPSGQQSTPLQRQSSPPQVSHPQPAQASVQSSGAAESETVQPASAVAQAVQAGPEQAGERMQKSEGQALPASSAATEQVAAPRADTVRALDQPADVRSADVDQTPPAAANATAVRDVRLQVAGADNQRVDVRVMDRGGELRVSVRADDPSLVQSLQDNVADLSTRLDQAHFRSEVWAPRTEAIAQTDSASTNGRTFSNGDGTFGRDGQGQQQNGRQQQQPSWVDDFEENPAGHNSGSTPQWQP